MNVDVNNIAISTLSTYFSAGARTRLAKENVQTLGDLFELVDSSEFNYDRGNKGTIDTYFEIVNTARLLKYKYFGLPLSEKIKFNAPFDGALAYELGFSVKSINCLLRSGMFNDMTLAEFIAKFYVEEDDVRDIWNFGTALYNETKAKIDLIVEHLQPQLECNAIEFDDEVQFYIEQNISLDECAEIIKNHDNTIAVFEERISELTDKNEQLRCSTECGNDYIMACHEKYCELLSELYETGSITLFDGSVANINDEFYSEKIEREALFRFLGRDKYNELEQNMNQINEYIKKIKVLSNQINNLYMTYFLLLCDEIKKRRQKEKK